MVFFTHFYTLASVFGVLVQNWGMKLNERDISLHKTTYAGDDISISKFAKNQIGFPWWLTVILNIFEIEWIEIETNK